MLQLKKSFFAFMVNVITDRRTAQRDCFMKNFLQCRVQLAKLLARNRSYSPARPNSGAEERFIGIDVANAAQQLLVQQCALYRRLAAAEELNEAVDLRLQWFMARSCESGTALRL